VPRSSTTARPSGLRGREGRGARLTAQDAAALPDAAQSRAKAVAAVGGHGGLDDLERLAERRDLEQVEPGAEEQVGELDGLLLQRLLLRHGGRHTGGDG